MKETIKTAAEVVRSLRRKGALVFILQGIEGIGISPAGALTPELRATLEAHRDEVREFLLTNPDHDVVRRFAHLSGAPIAWIDAGPCSRDAGCKI